VESCRPRTPSGGFPAKAVVGQSVNVSADVFRDGHDVLAAQVKWRFDADSEWCTVPMAMVGNDRWEATFVPAEAGSHHFVVEAWTDRAATLRRDIDALVTAGQDASVEYSELAALSDQPADVTAGPTMALWVDRLRALAGAWYEFFPRSEGGLVGSLSRLEAVAAMGFDVVYLPPIHPIGLTARKGPHNSLSTGPDDPGSPWAIGNAFGGHMAVEPSLGTIDDFDALVTAAEALGLEIALDYALQCSPDHPWVADHPEWFHRRTDGSIRFAENPPKRYEDIFPINFWPATQADREQLWEACAEILRFWIAHGIKIFRVDNPHTKPMAFWAWLIPLIHAENPEVVFLAEAFTRPKVMAKLAEVGFSQSYTYFTWRTSAAGLRSYVEEVTSTEKADFMRPNFWPNTPDILAEPLRNGPQSAFALRVVLAAMLVASYGIYSGYELGENQPQSETNEEYFDSEKFVVRRRDWSLYRDFPEDYPSIIGLITRLNAIRRAHPACAELSNVTFHHCGNDAVLAWSKRSFDGSDAVLVVVNLDPFSAQSDLLSLDLAALGLPWDRPFQAIDELSGSTFTWQGSTPYIRLDPAVSPAHIFSFDA